MGPSAISKKQDLTMFKVLSGTAGASAEVLESFVCGSGRLGLVGILTGQPGFVVRHRTCPQISQQRNAFSKVASHHLLLKSYPGYIK